MNLDCTLIIDTGKCNDAALKKAQRYLDQEVIRVCSPYVPHDTGTLEGSAETSTEIGSGTVTWSTPYAAKQYYEGKSNSMRGARWFDRAKADHENEWKDGIAKILGGEGNGGNN